MDFRTSIFKKCRKFSLLISVRRGCPGLFVRRGCRASNFTTPEMLCLRDYRTSNPKGKSKLSPMAFRTLCKTQEHVVCPIDVRTSNSNARTLTAPHVDSSFLGGSRVCLQSTSSACDCVTRRYRGKAVRKFRSRLASRQLRKTISAAEAFIICKVTECLRLLHQMQGMSQAPASA